MTLQKKYEPHMPVLIFERTLLLETVGLIVAAGYAASRSTEISQLLR